MKTNAQTDKQPKIFEVVKSALLDNLTDLDAPYACDIHHHLYNENEHFIYYAEAGKAADELSVWECVGVVQKYEQVYFGSIYTSLSNPCDVVNMVIYIMGQELLHQIFEDTKYFTKKWNDRLTDDELDKMLTIAEKWFKKNPDGLLEIWENLDY